MQRTPATADRSWIADRLRRHELFDGVADGQVDWLVERGTVRRLADGEVLFRDGEPATVFVVLLAGELLITKMVDGRQEVLTRHSAGAPDRPPAADDPKPSAAHGFTGEMPLLAGENYVADATAVGPTTVVTYDQDTFLEMFARIPRVSRVLLPVLAWRIQSSEALAGQRNTLQALGTMAAGLAHELNNPAAVVVRNASALEPVLRRLEAACFGLAAAGGPGDPAGGQAVRDLVAATAPPPALDSRARSAAEDALSEWLSRAGVARAGQLAGELADEGADEALLRRLADLVAAEQLGAAVNYLSSMLIARGLAREIREAGNRIAGLTGSVREYTNLDRAPRQAVDVAGGLDATLAMLAASLTGVRVIREYDSRVPVLTGFPGELNQVWTNLISNAVDAMRGAGTLRVATRLQGGCVAVEITDSGDGIPAAIADRIFDPFFTTKDVGKGTGLGLHLSHRIVTQRHRGAIRVDSAPGDTRFTVRLPVDADCGPAEDAPTP